MNRLTSRSTFIEHLFADRFFGDSVFVRYFLLSVIGSLLLWASAKVQVPMWPVPMTFQTFAVVLLGLMYGFRLGGATILLYLSEGALGLPVFAGGGGISYMFGTTGGYLFGFLLCFLFCGFMADRGFGKNFLSILLVSFIGMFIIYFFGVLWLSSFIGFDAAIMLGVFPFIFGDFIKCILCGLFLSLGWRWMFTSD